MDSPLPWAEKYRPKSLADVVGNGPAVAALKKWADSWENGVPDKRAVVLNGRAGVGKTSTAHAWASDLGWGVIELNASDARTDEAIRRVAGAGAINETFRDDGAFIRAAAGGRKLIILDEADNVFGKEDRGGLPAIVEMIRSTRQPVVLIVNDYYALTRRSSTLRSLAMEIKFQGLRSNQIEKVLRKVAAEEHVEVAPEVITQIAQDASGDLRAALNDLEGVAQGRSVVPKEAAAAIGGRDDRQTAYGMVGEVLHSFDIQAARKALRDLDESPDFALLWIEENVPLDYRHAEDLDRAFYYLSRADQFLGRTMRRQYFGLWAYASDLMGPGVAMAKGERLHGWSRYQFPTWLIQMGRSKAARKRRNETYGKLGAYFHTSRREIGNSVIPYLPRLMEADFDLAVNVAAGAALELEDVADLLDKEVESKEAQAIFREARRLLEAGAALGVAAEAKRGARKGSMSLGQAVEAARNSQTQANEPKRAKKVSPTPAAPPDDRPAEPIAEPKKEEEPKEGPPEPEKPKHRSLLEF